MNKAICRYCDCEQLVGMNSYDPELKKQLYYYVCLDCDGITEGFTKKAHDIQQRYLKGCKKLE